MEKRIVTIYSPIGKPQVRLNTNAVTFDEIANVVKTELGIDSLGNLKIIPDTENAKKHEIRGFIIPERACKLILTQDKTKNGNNIQEEINEIEEQIAKLRKAKKGGVKELLVRLEALKSNKTSAPVAKPVKTKKVPQKAEKAPKFVPLSIDVLTDDECVPIEDVKSILSANLRG